MRQSAIRSNLLQPSAPMHSAVTVRTQDHEVCERVLAAELYGSDAMNRENRTRSDATGAAPHTVAPENLRDSECLASRRRDMRAKTKTLTTGYRLQTTS
jgi:hypothetical protein